MRPMHFLPMTLLLAITPAVAGDRLSDRDRDALVEHLKQSRAALLAEVDGLSQAQLTWQPAGDKWAIVDCIEHLARSETALFGLAGQLVKSEGGARAEVADDAVLSVIVDRQQTFDAPGPVRPTREWATSAEPLQKLLESRDRSLKFVQSTNLDLRGHVSPNPAVGGNMDAYQWLLFMSGHTLRHTEQIREIKSDPGFPK